MLNKLNLSWDDYVECNFNPCINQSHKICKEEFQEKLDRSQLAKEFFQLESFKNKVDFFRRKELFPFGNTVYDGDIENKVFGLNPKTKEEILLFNKLVLEVVRENVFKRNLSKAFGFSIKKTEDLKNIFLYKLENSPLNNKEEILELEKKRINDIFKEYDKAASNFPSKKSRTTDGILVTHPPKFQSIYCDKINLIPQNIPTVKIEFPHVSYFERRVAITQYVDYYIHLKNFDLQAYQLEKNPVLYSTKLPIKVNSPDTLFKSLITNKFIEPNASISDFRSILLGKKEKLSTPFKWIDKARNKQYTKRTLFTFLEEALPNFTASENYEWIEENFIGGEGNKFTYDSLKTTYSNRKNNIFRKGKNEREQLLSELILA